jgi:hypothetical protein
MIYEIKIILKGSKPKIWRRVRINPNISLDDLHKIIQTAMGWTNSHLHHFISGKKFYGNPDDDEYGDMNIKDSKKFKILKILESEGSSIIYEYDFGDGWEHEIKLEKIDEDINIIHPLCIAGKRNCPPEDSGGVWGYQEMLEIIKDKNHEEYEDTIEWMGTDFDPDYFDIDDTNEALAQKDYGCIEIMY